MEIGGIVARRRRGIHLQGLVSLFLAHTHTHIHYVYVDVHISSLSLSHPPWKHLFDMLYGVTVKLITPSLEKLSDSKRPGPCECSNADVARRRKILYSTYMLHITTYIHGYGAPTEKESEREADSF